MSQILVDSNIFIDISTEDHVLTAGIKLLTRDTVRFRTCFPKLELICPHE
jgi:hypothetical protein